MLLVQKGDILVKRGWNRFTRASNQNEHPDLVQFRYKIPNQVQMPLNNIFGSNNLPNLRCLWWTL